MRVRLRNPDRDVEVAGGRTVRQVLVELDVDPDTVLVIRSGELLTRQSYLTEGDEVEVRPVISGGAAEASGQVAR
jgi:sulfur carrier protein